MTYFSLSLFFYAILPIHKLGVTIGDPKFPKKTNLQSRNLRSQRAREGVIMQRNLLKQFGNDAEELGVRFLQEAGYVIVERNYYARKLGEIDIIAHREGVWHFVEVKSANADFDPIYNLTASKLRKVINSAQYFLKERSLDVSFSIDALIIRRGEVELIENITL